MTEIYWQWQIWLGMFFSETPTPWKQPSGESSMDDLVYKGWLLCSIKIVAVKVNISMTVFLFANFDLHDIFRHYAPFMDLRCPVVQVALWPSNASYFKTSWKQRKKLLFFKCFTVSMYYNNYITITICQYVSFWIYRIF